MPENIWLLCYREDIIIDRMQRRTDLGQMLAAVYIYAILAMIPI